MHVHVLQQNDLICRLLFTQKKQKRFKGLGVILITQKIGLEKRRSQVIALNVYLLFVHNSPCQCQ